MTYPVRAHLQTARLGLRPLTAADETAVVTALNNLDVSGWLAVVPHPYRSADFHEFLPRARPAEVFAFDDDAGFAGIVALDEALGYRVDPRRWGRGYGFEAASAVLYQHFSSGGGDVIASCAEGNVASARVLAKLGFAETGGSMKFCRATGNLRPARDLVLTPVAFSGSPMHDRMA